MVKFSELKIDDEIELKELGGLGEAMKSNPKVIAIRYEIYDKKSGLHVDFKLSCNDYDEIMETLK